MKFAAIDIGTNAIRLLVARVLEGDRHPEFKKDSLTRVPIRLGSDVFGKGRISKGNADRVVKSMQAFHLLMDVQGVESYGGCATAAMREAKNGPELVERIAREADVRIDIIDGRTEAKAILSTSFTQDLDSDKAYLYIDVGGGSTEISLLVNGKRKKSRSFELGTIRILKEKVPPDEWDELKEYVRDLVLKDRKIEGIGTGGNINKLFKMCSSSRANDVLAYADLKALSKELAGLSVAERIEEYRLKPDRADVIVPASKIYLTVMKTAKIDKIVVPRVGLADGLIYEQYRRHQKALRKRGA